MKKIISITAFFILSLQTSVAFFLDNWSLDLYKNIDSGYYKLKNKVIEKELWWEDQKWIAKWINKLAKREWYDQCLDESKVISYDDIYKIVDLWDIETLKKHIWEKCWFALDTYNTYISLFKRYKTEINKISSEKSKKIYNISNIWLYADWIEENSPFDLITDIKDIDFLIFESENEYNWGDLIDLWDIFKINDIDNKIYTPFENNTNNEINNNIQNEELENSTTSAENYEIMNSQSSYICVDENQNNLSEASTKNILEDIENEINNENVNVDLNNKIEEKRTWNSDINNLNSNYKKVTDNSIWPCDSFFCITIEFITYKHSLFWWSSNITLEYLINRSNEHLKKAAATSLVPSKMTTNNFELGLKDLDLSSIFHMWFIISSKPIPILNIANEWKIDESELSAKNMLEKYYEIYWLDYKRRNDLNMFEQIETQKQTILNSNQLTNENQIYLMNEYYKKYLKEKQKISNYIEKSIKSKSSYELTKKFEEQFTEIDKFSKSLSDYIDNLSSLLKSLKEIPTDKS